MKTDDLVEFHARNFEEYKKQLDIDNIKFKKLAGWQFVPVKDILPISYSRPDWNENTPGFWEHHAKTHADYVALAEQYSFIVSYIIWGYPFRSLAQKRETRQIFGLWFNKKDPVRIIQFKGSCFVSSGLHRAAVLMQYSSAMVPAIVHEALMKKTV
ncbi:MAG: hypothetical protein M0Z61_17000 [Nitrospiraceae bacterium]|nr:hypothetical protein [Nitrospiraceae bacterium]